MYERYDIFKGWDEYFSTSPEQKKYFQKEFKDIDVAGKRILEIGFGSGALLSWLSEKAKSVTGIEINSRSLENAKSLGYEAYPDLDLLRRNDSTAFDVVVAFDVFEHLTVPELESLLRKIKSILADNGKLIIRVPNGRSPWGLANQYGDLTHKTVLSDLRIAQLGLETGFDLKECRNYSITFRKGVKNWCLDAVKYPIRKSINWLLALAFGWRGMPLEENIIAILVPKNNETPG